MKESLSIRLSISFIYMWFLRMFYLNHLFYSETTKSIIVCFISAICLTLFLEAFHFLIIDFIQYTKIIVFMIILLSIVFIYFTHSLYIFVITIYIAINMIYDLIKCYQMNHLLIQFHKEKK